MRNSYLIRPPSSHPSPILTHQTASIGWGHRLVEAKKWVILRRFLTRPLSWYVNVHTVCLLRKTLPPVHSQVYFGLMLDVANEWLELEGRPRNATWDRIAQGLSQPYVDPASPPGTPLYSFNFACAWSAPD